MSSLARCGKVFEPAQAGRERSIQPEAVCLADGTFALFRKEGKVTAVRLTTITPPLEGQVSSGCARYEAYAFASSGAKGAAGARSEGILSTFELRGVHPFNWQPGNDRLRVEPADPTLVWYRPDSFRERVEERPEPKTGGQPPTPDRR